MSVANATRAQLNAVYENTAKLEVMLRQYNDGSASKDKPHGRFTVEEIDTQVAALRAALDTASTPDAG